MQYIGIRYSTDITVVRKLTKTPSTQEKFKRAALVTNKIAAIVAEKSGSIFEKHMKTLENIYELWSQGKEIVVTEVTQEKNISINTVPELPNFSCPDSSTMHNSQETRLHNVTS